MVPLTLETLELIPTLTNVLQDPTLEPTLQGLQVQEVLQELEAHQDHLVPQDQVDHLDHILLDQVDQVDHQDLQEVIVEDQVDLHLEEQLEALEEAVEAHLVQEEDHKYKIDTI